jgi:hypothetical protein
MGTVAIKDQNVRRNLYICNIYSGDVHELYQEQIIINKFESLSNRYNITYLWQGIRVLKYEPSLIVSKILKDINNTEIVIACISDEFYHYSDTILELGMALAVKKPIVIWCQVHNIYVEESCIYQARGVIKVTTWYGLKQKLDEISNIIEELENKSSASE